MANKALVNYYAKLIKRNQYSINQVPDELRPLVLKQTETLVAEEDQETKSIRIKN